VLVTTKASVVSGYGIWADRVMARSSLEVENNYEKAFEENGDDTDKKWRGSTLELSLGWASPLVL
jgi:hypothetical protein